MVGVVLGCEVISIEKVATWFSLVPLLAAASSMFGCPPRYGAGWQSVGSQTSSHLAEPPGGGETKRERTCVSMHVSIASRTSLPPHGRSLWNALTNICSGILQAVLQSGCRSLSHDQLPPTVL